MANTLDQFPTAATTIGDTDLMHVKVGTGVNSDKKITGLNVKALFAPAVHTHIGLWDVSDDTDFNYGHGLNALNSLIASSGKRNVGAGQDAGTAITTGDDNLVLGDSAGKAGLITGSSNIMIGSGADVLADGDAQVVIGSGITLPMISGVMRAITDVDISSDNLTLRGTSALPTASTNLDAGGLIVEGGLAMPTGIGVGGDLTLRGGDGGDTGTKGGLILDYGTFPAADGSDGQFLKTNGAGALSWDDAGGGGFTSIVDDETDDNYAIGPGALDSLTPSSGLRNIGIGRNAGTAMTTGDNSVFIGDDAGMTLSGNYSGNIGIGGGALKNCTGGTGNIALGYLAGIAHQNNGNYNIAIGYQAGDNVTTGAYNIIMGYAAGTITTGSRNMVMSNGATTNIPDPTTGIAQMNIGNVLVGAMNPITDAAIHSGGMNVQGPDAFPSASTNQDGGDLNLVAGASATAAGDGGDLTFAAGSGTTNDGNIILNSLPTSDPTVAGAIWNNSGVLNISAG